MFNHEIEFFTKIYKNNTNKLKNQSIALVLVNLNKGWLVGFIKNYKVIGDVANYGNWYTNTNSK